MKYKTIQAIHEVRMCITGLVIGGAAIAAFIDTHPAVKQKLNNAVDNIKGAFNKNHQPKEVITFVVVETNEEEKQG